MSTKNFELSKEQTDAERTIASSPKKKEKPLFLTGGGGCGKTTTIIEALRSMLGGNDTTNNSQKVFICATTSAAAKVLNDDIAESDLDEDDVVASTMHSAFNILPTVDNATTNGADVVSFNIPTEVPKKLEGSILIVDECSMLDKRMVKFIIKNRREFYKVVFVGDECQLPPVSTKNNPVQSYQFEKNLPTIELTVNQRAGKDTALSEYYQECRNRVKTGTQLSEYPGAEIFTNTSEAIDKARSYSENFCVLSYTNKTADKNAEILGHGALHVGDEVRLLATYRTKRRDDEDQHFKVTNKEVVVVKKIFDKWSDMATNASKNDYPYWVPKQSAEFKKYAKKVSWVRAETSIGDTVYLALLYAVSTKDHSQAIADMPNEIMRQVFTRIMSGNGFSEYTQLQDVLIKHKQQYIRKYLNSRFEGAHKKAKMMKKYWHIEKTLYSMNSLYEIRAIYAELWKDLNVQPIFDRAQAEYFRFQEMIPSRSKFCGTVHSAQGITVDTVVINWDELVNRKDRRLLYTALTRSGENIILIKK